MIYTWACGADVTPHRRALTSIGGALGTVAYTVGGTQFPYDSPSHRFFIVGQPVSYVCAPAAGITGTLRRRSGYTIQATQPTVAGGALLAGSVTACSFTYNNTTSARQAVVTLRLTLTRNTESITLLKQVFVESSP